MAYDEEHLCRCGCGLPMEEAHADRPFIVHTFTCNAGRALAQARRKADDEAKTKKKPDGWDDGLHYYVKPYEPEENPRGD